MEETPLEAFGDAPPAPPCDGTVVVDADADDDDADARVAALSSAKAQNSPTMASLKRLEGDARHLAGDVCEIAEDLADDAARGLEAAATEAVDDLLYGAHLLGRRARWASALFTLAALGGLSLLGTHGVWYLAWYVPPSLPPLWWKLGMGLRWLAAPVGLGPAAYEELARARLAPRDPLAALGRFLAARRAAYAAADDGAPADDAAAPSFSLLAVFGVKRFARRAKASKRRLDEKKPALSLERGGLGELGMGRRDEGKGLRVGYMPMQGIQFGVGERVEDGFDDVHGLVVARGVEEDLPVREPRRVGDFDRRAVDDVGGRPEVEADELAERLEAAVGAENRVRRESRDGAAGRIERRRHVELVGLADPQLQIRGAVFDRDFDLRYAVPVSSGARADAKRRARADAKRRARADAADVRRPPRRRSTSRRRAERRCAGSARRRPRARP